MIIATEAIYAERVSRQGVFYGMTRSNSCDVETASQKPLAVTPAPQLKCALSGAAARTSGQFVNLSLHVARSLIE
jgi:hypothetical protein